MALAQAGVELQGVGGVDAVVAQAGGNQHARVAAFGIKIVVGRQRGQERAHGFVVGVAVFFDPAGAGGKTVVAQHIGQRHFAHQRADAFRLPHKR